MLLDCQKLVEKGKGYIKTGEAHLIYQVGSRNWHRGVSFFIDKKIKKRVIEIKGGEWKGVLNQIEIDPPCIYVTLSCKRSHFVDPGKWDIATFEDRVKISHFHIFIDSDRKKSELLWHFTAIQ